MIDHTGFIVADLARSKAFYLQALAPLGYAIGLELEQALGFAARAHSRGTSPVATSGLPPVPPINPVAILPFVRPAVSR